MNSEWYETKKSNFYGMSATSGMPSTLWLVRKSGSSVTFRIHGTNCKFKLISISPKAKRQQIKKMNFRCPEQKYASQLPTVSIIICFYNEHIVTLLRSVTTILKRTPANVLKEIILVDDYSDLDDLKETLEQEIDKINVNNTIRLVRNDKREGLIRSRVYGSRNATGEVLLFLDSHIEVNVQWIEPLLARVKENRTTLVMPVIDIINADTFAYTSSPLVRGGFNWGLHFKWDNLPKGTLTKDADFLGPFPSPTMVGSTVK